MLFWRRKKIASLETGVASLLFQLVMTSKLYNNGLVSIGMPTYNRAPLLGRALDSLLAQTHKNFELIISDDGSTDRTLQVCKEYALRDKRIRYIHHPQNIGHVVNFEYVMRQAKGDYFMWAADDDHWDKTFIEKLLIALEKKPKANIAMSSFQRIFSDGEIYDTVVFEKDNDLNKLGHSALYEKVFRREPIHHCVYGIYKKDFIDKLFSRPKPEGIHWDRIFLGEVALASHIASVPEVLFFKDQHRISLKKRYKEQALGQAYRESFAYSKYLWRLFWSPFTSSLVPFSRKLKLPFYWTSALYFDRKRVLW